MKSILLIALGTALVVPVLSPAAAHSLADLQATLVEREKHFLPRDAAAPQFTVKGADSRLIRLADFQGKVVVLHFIDSDCREECSRHIDRLAEVQSMVNQSPMKSQVQFVTVAIDPAANDNASPTELGGTHGLDPINWMLLTREPGQPEGTIRKVAEQFGLRFESTEGGNHIHGIVTHVIDKDGRWRADFRGLKFEPTNLVVFVNALINDIAKPHEEPNPTLWQKLKRWF